MWPNRRLIDLLGIEHPIVQSPMAGFSTVELAAAVCDAGALGSIGCGPVSPEIAARTIRQLRGLTSKPINVNFFSHASADATSGQQQVWRDRLSPYYRELGGDPQASSSPTVLPAFGDDMCSVVEQFRPEVVVSFRLAWTAVVDPGQIGGLPRHVIRDDRGGGAVARGPRRRCDHCPGL